MTVASSSPPFRGGDGALAAVGRTAAWTVMGLIVLITAVPARPRWRSTWRG